MLSFMSINYVIMLILRMKNNYLIVFKEYAFINYLNKNPLILQI